MPKINGGGGGINNIHELHYSTLKENPYERYFPLYIWLLSSPL